MKNFSKAALIPTFVFGIAGCATEAAPSPEETRPSTTAEDQGVKDVGTFPAGPETKGQVGIDHWNVYRTSKDVVVIVGQNADDVTLHTTTITFANDAQGKSYVREMHSDAKALEKTFTLELGPGGEVLKADGDQTAAQATGLLGRDIDTASLHKEEYGWWGCVGWSLGAVGGCIVATTSCVVGGVVTLGATCYGASLVCVGGSIGAADACYDAWKAS